MDKSSMPAYRLNVVYQAINSHRKHLEIVGGTESDLEKHAGKLLVALKEIQRQSTSAKRRIGDENNRDEEPHKKAARGVDLNVMPDRDDEENQRQSTLAALKIDLDESPVHEGEPQKEQNISQLDENAKAFISELRKMYFPIFARFDY
uniref:Uncharacterized protein n=1 Tax=Oryza sativa subsp. japonica TaxID=39947 RepID=Q6YWH5_ORYSJ|nr:hypothetical protein [Oryza sativa Japonica Group]